MKAYLNHRGASPEEICNKNWKPYQGNGRKLWAGMWKNVSKNTKNASKNTTNLAQNYNKILNSCYAHKHYANSGQVSNDA